ncbi:MAG: hypothetical protein ACI88A_003374 [Paraglaciecola sp.]|jgi:hypothetical protein
MNTKRTVFTILFIYLGVSLSAFAASNGGGKISAFNLVGAGAMYEGLVPDIDGDGVEDAAICFDVDLFNIKNGQLVGTATDCLSNINPVGTGLALVGTTYFHLPQGTLVTRGNTTVQPVTQNTVTPTGQVITHITGASGTGNSILYGDGKFAGSTGTLRLSGMVDLSNFTGTVGDPIAFDCLFVINVD